MKRMDSVFDRVEDVFFGLQLDWTTKTTGWRNANSREYRYMLCFPSNIVPPGKPIPPMTKKIQGSVNSMMEKAKNSMDSSKSGDMKEKLAGSMSTLGEKMSNMMDKAKNTVQGFRSYVCFLESILMQLLLRNSHCGMCNKHKHSFQHGVNATGKSHFHPSAFFAWRIEDRYVSLSQSMATSFFTSACNSTTAMPMSRIPTVNPRSNSKTIMFPTSNFYVAFHFQAIHDNDEII